MNLRFWKKSAPSKPKGFIQEWTSAITFAVVVATLFRWSIVEAYVIPSESMENTMLVGDYLFVSKFHYGTRTPRTLIQMPLTHQHIWGTKIPSYLPWIQLPTYRLPGIGHIEREDIVVFHGPTLAQNEGVEYPIDLKTNIVKRCVGVPGDRIRVTDRQLTVNEQPLKNPVNMKFSYFIRTKDEISKRNLSLLGLNTDDYYVIGRTKENQTVYRMTLTERQAGEMKLIPYILGVDDDYTTNDGPDATIFPSLMRASWNGDNYGSVTVPAKGMKILVNDSTMAVYGETIRAYDLNENAEVRGSQLFIDGNEVHEYTFKQDYYFMMGDNRHASFDSRYWGFVPEDHVVGKALFVWMSIDNQADFLNKVRWNRLFTRIR